MGMTMTQKILARKANLPSVSAGQLIFLDVDMVLGNDITSPVAIGEFRKYGMTEVFGREKIAIVLDHFTPNKDIKAAEQCMVLSLIHIFRLQTERRCFCLYNPQSWKAGPSQ